MANEYKSWRELRDAFFTYTRAERNGIFVLVTLIVLLNCYHLYCKFFRVETYDYSAAIAEIDAAFEDSKEITEAKISLFEFNPNFVTEEEMLKLGFKSRAIKTFLKYRSAGAKFRNINDFEKVYSIDSLDIERVKDYIVFDQPKSTHKNQKRKPSTKTKVVKSAAPTLFDFDPNTASEKDLKRLGISQRVAKTMLKFRSKGAFRKPSDLSKIYGLRKDQFEKLLPFIKIKQHKSTAKHKVKSLEDSSIEAGSKKLDFRKKWVDTVAYKSIDINRATVEEWQRIDGIGPTYAKMINKYRSKLGGFFDVSQVGETYGIPDSVFQKVIPFVKSSSPLEKIPINFILTDSLAKHPYLTWKQANVITNYRSKHGPFSSPREIAKVKIFTKEKWERIVPYLDYETAVDTFDHSGD